MNERGGQRPAEDPGRTAAAAPDRAYRPGGGRPVAHRGLPLSQTGLRTPARRPGGPGVGAAPGPGRTPGATAGRPERRLSGAGPHPGPGGHSGPTPPGARRPHGPRPRLCRGRAGLGPAAGQKPPGPGPFLLPGPTVVPGLITLPLSRPPPPCWPTRTFWPTWSGSPRRQSPRPGFNNSPPWERPSVTCRPISTRS